MFCDDELCKNPQCATAYIILVMSPANKPNDANVSEPLIHVAEDGDFCWYVAQ